MTEQKPSPTTSQFDFRICTLTAIKGVDVEKVLEGMGATISKISDEGYGGVQGVVVDKNKISVPAARSVLETLGVYVSHTDPNPQFSDAQVA
jgi:hypothetical protein